jgi:hypothetical protein
MMKELFSTVAATVAVIASISVAASIQAQQQTRITVDGKDYTVTEFSSPRGPQAMHMVQLADVQTGLSAMVSVQNGKITAYISPPGGGGQQDLINKVWDAYQAQKNGNSAANSGAAPPGGTGSADPNAALRAQADAINAQALARAGMATTAATTPTVKEFPAGGGVVVTKGSRTITFTADGADATIVDQSVTGKTRTEKASYEGDGTDNDYKFNAGKFSKGLGTATLYSMSPMTGEHRIQGTNDRWKITDDKGHTLNSSGGFDASNEAHAGQKNMGDEVLSDVYAAEQAAKDEAAKRKAAGQTVQFDPNSTPRGQHAYKALETYVGTLSQ